VRGGFVYKTEDDLIDTSAQPLRPASAFTVPFTFVDIGLDGRRGTADDANIQMLGLPAAQASQFPTTTIVSNTEQFSRAKTVEVSMTRRYANRWSASVGGAYTMLTDFGQNNAPQRNPNNPGAQDRTLWNLKATGSYDAAWGIRLSPVLRHQSGTNYARTVTITAPTGLIATSGGTGGNIAFVEAGDANREDNIWVFDIRAEKTIPFGARSRARLFFDLFNITNSYASETISRATGLGYQKPSAILAPRTARLGVRFLW